MMLPLARALRKRLAGSGPRPVILMYHRVADIVHDPWGIAVGCARFEEQMTALRRHRQPLAMREFVDGLERGDLPREAVAVTFDDGYVDNVTNAKPRLAREQVPATFFLATGSIGQSIEYWWDELARLILSRTEPIDIEIATGRDPIQLRLDRPIVASTCWRAEDGCQTPHQATYIATWRALRALEPGARAAAMAGLRRAFNAPSPAPSDLPMSETEIAQLIADPRLTIGGHTVSHTPLPALGPDARKLEIEQGKRDCELLAGGPVDGFAYPHGAMDDASRAAVRDSGFQWACSTRHGPVSSRNADRYALPRIAVGDWDGAALLRAIDHA